MVTDPTSVGRGLGCCANDPWHRAAYDSVSAVPDPVGARPSATVGREPLNAAAQAPATSSALTSVRELTRPMIVAKYLCKRLKPLDPGDRQRRWPLEDPTKERCEEAECKQPAGEDPQEGSWPDQ